MIKPMLCETGSSIREGSITVGSEDFKRQNYAYEWKYDGTRLFIDKKKEAVTLQNRKGIDYTRRLPDVVAATKKVPGSFTLDSEVVYINPVTGKVEFTPCQRRCATKDWAKIIYLQQKFPVTVMNFDILELDGENLEKEPLRERKPRLHELLSKYRGALQFAEHSVLQFVDYNWDKEGAWKEVLNQGEEGLILKDINSRYEHERSWKWLKIKNWRWITGICPEGADVVGYTPGKNARMGFFGSLVLAKNGKFIGCVGSGFNDWDLRQVKEILDAPEMARPFSIGEYYTAVKTNLKVDVKYYKITENGVMRFPVFEKIIK